MPGCEPSSSGDATPPDVSFNLVKSQGKYRFGVTDTVVVTFSEAVDTAALVVSISPAQGIVHKFVGKSKLLIYGDAMTYGVHYFPVGAAFELTLTKLKDSKGNLRDPVDELFLSYPWLDRDFLDSTFDSYDSLYRNDSTWVDGGPYRDSLILEGSLDFQQTLGAIDYQDYKTVLLIPPDTLFATLTTSKGVNLKFQAAGPFAPDSFAAAWKTQYFSSIFDSSQTGSTGKATVKVIADFNTHFNLFNHNASAPGIYVFRITIPQDQQGFYRLALGYHSPR